VKLTDRQLAIAASVAARLAELVLEATDDEISSALDMNGEGDLVGGADEGDSEGYDAFEAAVFTALKGELFGAEETTCALCDSKDVPQDGESHECAACVAAGAK
jgi:hypothetical protein